MYVYIYMYIYVYIYIYTCRERERERERACQKTSELARLHFVIRMYVCAMRKHVFLDIIRTCEYAHVYKHLRWLRVRTENGDTLRVVLDVCMRCAAGHEAEQGWQTKDV